MLALAMVAVAAMGGLGRFANAQAAPCIEIELRSGQVGGAPGTPGQADSLIRRHPTTGSRGMAISVTPFSPSWFADARNGPPATVTTRNPAWLDPSSSFPSAPQSRWISHVSDSRRTGGSAFYAIPFTVDAACINRAVLDLFWAVDDSLGDPIGDPFGDANPSGVYVNGDPLPISGGTFSSPFQSTGVPMTNLVPGQNWLYIYARDSGTSASGLLFNARVRVWCCPEPCEVINLRSGQVGGVPGRSGQLDDVVERHPIVSGGRMQLSSTPFSTAGGWFPHGPTWQPAYVIRAHSEWIASLPCDPEARWVNYDSGAGHVGSVLYAIPFNVASTCIDAATLSLCWAADDTLGDQIPGGPNWSGAYLNGVPLPISGGGFTSESTAVANVGGILQPGPNTLYLYQRDSGTFASGLIYSASIKVICCPTPPPACTPPPRNMVLWMPFEEPGGSSTTANILMNPSGNGTLSGGVGLGYSPGAVGSATSFDQGQIDVAPYTALALDNDMTIDAWVNLWDFSIAREHTIVDKRQFSTAFPDGWRGYRFYVETAPVVGGPLKLEFSDGVGVVHVATGPVISLNSWEHVAVTIDRNASAPGDTVVSFAHNGVCSVGLSLPGGTLTGILGIAATRVGDTFDQSVLNQWFGGHMDELEIFSRALSCSEIAAIAGAGSAGKCKEFCQVEWDRSFYHGDATIRVPARICNNTATSQTYSLTINPLVCPFSSTSSPVGITTNPVSPIVVPAYGCSTVWLTIPRPPFSGLGDTSCYEICMTNVVTGASHCCQGSVQDSGSIFIDWPILGPGSSTLATGVLTSFMIPIMNPSGSGVLLDYRVSVVGPDMMLDTTTVSLDGMDPGTPIEGTLDLPAGATRDLDFTAMFTLDDPGQWYSILLEMDLDGDGTFEAVESISVTGGLADPCPPVIAEDFEFYIPETAPCGIGGWQPWTGSTDVCGLVTTEQAFSGVRSLKIVGAVGGSTGLGDDMVQRFDLTSGRHVLSLATYVPVGSTGRGWVVLLSEYPAPFNWALNLMLDADAGVIRDEQDAGLSRPLAFGRWATVEVVVDLDADTVDVFYDGVRFIAGKSWTLGVPPSGPATFKALDLYADEPISSGGSGTSGMYFDDISLRTLCEPAAPPCVADCDGDGSLNIFDFLCFQNRFASGDLAADLDGDGQLTVFDFLAFQNEFDAGCP